MAEYYHNLVTEKSFQLLMTLNQEYKFILIGGWAVYLLTQSLKSKDIDVVVSFEELAKLRQSYEVAKNDRLKKYEVKRDEIDIDIYVPHYSKIGIPAEDIQNHTTSREGFAIPVVEVLLILKQAALLERQGTPKGEKDMLDIISLLVVPYFDLGKYKGLLKKYDKKDFENELKRLLDSIQDAPELNMNRHKFSRFKKQILSEL